jgi:DMSO/TMAO reductase YedYZ molybdopterin-dependent catalytic subunit
MSGRSPSRTRNTFGLILVGLLSGLGGGLLMLLVALLLRWLLGFPTATEMIFDRAFPLVSIDVFIKSIVLAGGYTPLKISGVVGALGGQLIVAMIAGVLYAFCVGRWFGAGPDRISQIANRTETGSEDEKLADGPSLGRQLKFVLPILLLVWLAFVLFLWPTLLTQYHGVPPSTATWLGALGLLLDFSACAFGIMLFYRLLTIAPLETAKGSVERPTSRRSFLALALMAGIAVVFAGILRRLYQLGTFFYDGNTYDGPDIAQVTPADKFYSVTKNIVDPDVVRNIWRLEVGGLVEEPKTFSFDEIAAMPAVEQETTLMCISNPIGGGLMSNAVWRGVSLPDLLRPLRPKPPIEALLFHAADGYYETVPWAKAMERTTLLAYDMNGQPLPRIHGFPLRMVVPGLYGEKNPKWLTKIELLAANDPRLVRRHGCGFYKEQGWGPNFSIPTFSRIDSPKARKGRFEEPFRVGHPVEIRGIAFGGDRGISKVELSHDKEKTWQEATIAKAGSKISWSIWTFAFTPDQPGEVVFAVRATDGNGQLQIAEERGTVPQGATGMQRLAAKVEA